MAADLFAVAGATVHMGPAMELPDDQDMVAADYDAVVFTQIKGWMQCGAFGDTRTLITSQLIDRDRDIKQAGTANAGSWPNVFAILPTDPGQVMLRAAAGTKRNHPFKVIWDDAPEGGTPSVDFFMGIVMTAQNAGGGPNVVRALNSTVEINTNIANVAAAA